VLAQNTHDLVLRWLSALPLRERPRLVTTEGEFHTIRRQLDRLAEEGVEVVKVPARPAGPIAERLLACLDDRTAAVLVSAVLFESAAIVPDLGAVMEGCRRHGAELLVDTYHALNVMPFPVSELGLERAFVVGGGYKYCQLGEGNCCLRVPEGCRLRPVITGWFSEFELLDTARADGRVRYPDGPARFAGSTYDPTSHYRAAEVFRFFHDHHLSPELLREVSQHQVGLLAARFDALDADPGLIRRERSVPLSEIGGFLVLSSPRAAEICQALRERGVFTDVRGDALRLGPAPYLSDAQLEQAMAAFAETIR
jgi:selenocysteine lyase/cysteine desulfurase